MHDSSASRKHAFGLDIETSYPVPHLPAAQNPVALPGPSLELVSIEETQEAWPSRGSATVLDRRSPSGRAILVIEQHAEAGFRIWGTRHGRHIVSSDGLSIRSALPRIAAWRWERLLFAQPLPLAAALCGLDVFHASAVAVNGTAIAFVASSGTGKSSLAAHLVARGASFVTDDVLALEPTPDGVVAHPGAGLVGIDTRERAAMDDAGRARLGMFLGQAEKEYLAIDVADRPLPLAALYLLRRNGLTPRDLIEVSAERAPALLGCSYLSYLRSPQHLARHLEVCAVIASSVPVFEVMVSQSSCAAALVEVIEAHIEDTVLR